MLVKDLKVGDRFELGDKYIRGLGFLGKAGFRKGDIAEVYDIYYSNDFDKYSIGIVNINDKKIYTNFWRPSECNILENIDAKTTIVTDNIDNPRNVSKPNNNIYLNEEDKLVMNLKLGTAFKFNNNLPDIFKNSFRNIGIEKDNILVIVEAKLYDELSNKYIIKICNLNDPNKSKSFTLDGTINLEKLLNTNLFNIKKLIRKNSSVKNNDNSINNKNHKPLKNSLVTEEPDILVRNIKPGIAFKLTKKVNGRLADFLLQEGFIMGEIIVVTKTKQISNEQFRLYLKSANNPNMCLELDLNGDVGYKTFISEKILNLRALLKNKNP